MAGNYRSDAAHSLAKEIAVTSANYIASQSADPIKRSILLAELVESHTGPFHHVPFREGYIDALIVSVNDDVLIYRANNGRLISELVALGASREQSNDQAQQQLLHDLLLEKARHPDGPIYAELERHGKQTEPLLIAADGVVINGNRRLAAMRELRAADPQAFSDFAKVSVAILPNDLSSTDLEYIEAALQLAPELKLDYSWINRRLKLRDHVERLGLGEEAIIAAYRFDDASAIDRELAELVVAETFLRYCGEPGNYGLIQDLEEPLIGMKRELAAFSNLSVVEPWTLAGFALLRERDKLDRNLKHYFPFTRPVPFELVHWVLRTFAEEEGLAEPQRDGENRPVDHVLGEQLKTVLNDRVRSLEIATRLCRLSNELRRNEERVIGGAQTLAFLRKAKQNLQRIETVEISAVQRREIRDELLALNDYLERYSATIGGAPSGKASPKTVLSKLIGRD